MHGDKYDYSNVEYVNNDIKVCIICPIHGEFWQLPNAHLQGHGCCKCANNKKLTTEEFIEKAKEVHGDKYDYSKVEYINNKTKVIITCHIHGEFLQLPNAHLQGHGCDKCNESHLEKEIVNNLINNKIEYIREYKFTNLKRKEFDFYLPKYNIVIECQGEQHFNKKHFFDKKDSYNNRIKRDIDKYEFCKKNCIELLYYKNSKQIICEELYFYTKDNTFDNVNDLIEYIKKS